jgi:hypothetical protein
MISPDTVITNPEALEVQDWGIMAVIVNLLEASVRLPNQTKRGFHETIGIIITEYSGDTHAFTCVVLNLHAYIIGYSADTHRYDYAREYPG